MNPRDIENPIAEADFRAQLQRTDKAEDYYFKNKDSCRECESGLSLVKFLEYIEIQRREEINNIKQEIKDGCCPQCRAECSGMKLDK